MGTWSVPNTLKDAQKLVELMEQPLAAKDAPDKLYELFGDDALYDDIGDESARTPDLDVRPIVGLHIESILETVNISGIWNVEWDQKAIQLLKDKIVSQWGKNSNATRKFKRDRDLNRRNTRSKKSKKTKKKVQVSSRKGKSGTSKKGKKKC